LGEVTEDRASAAATEHVRRLEMAAGYMRTNGFTTPVLTSCIATVIWSWFPAWQAFGWAALAALAQIAMGLTAHAFLRDPDRLARQRVWLRRMQVAGALAAFGFGGAALLFYLPGERLNNLLLIATLVAAIATLAAMMSPSPSLMYASTLPHCAILLFVTALHEQSPFNLMFPFLAVLFYAEIFMTSGKLKGTVSRMVDLQIRNDALIQTLAREKRDADEARWRAESASQAKSNFLANMSHELRTPLNAILGFSEVIQNRVFGDRALDRYADYAKDIHGSGRHLLALIDDILDLARIEAGKLDLHEEAVAVLPVLQEVAGLLARQAAEGGIRLDVRCAAQATLWADARALKQIVLNLASNAMKFTPAGGTVALRGEGMPCGGFRLMVTDTGCGIAPENLARVLERFGQARSEVAAEKGRGTGLGLPIVKGLAEAHQAKLTLRSEVGRGTEVSVDVPAARVLARQMQSA
jgi:two-component system cell cycle sensor histidine kinase PleC